jgi:hypothetical protein
MKMNNGIFRVMQRMLGGGKQKYFRIRSGDSSSSDEEISED